MRLVKSDVKKEIGDPSFFCLMVQDIMVTYGDQDQSPVPRRSQLQVSLWSWMCQAPSSERHLEPVEAIPQVERLLQLDCEFRTDLYS